MLEPGKHFGNSRDSARHVRMDAKRFVQRELRRVCIANGSEAELRGDQLLGVEALWAECKKIFQV